MCPNSVLDMRPVNVSQPCVSTNAVSHTRPSARIIQLPRSGPTSVRILIKTRMQRNLFHLLTFLQQSRAKLQHRRAIGIQAQLPHSLEQAFGVEVWPPLQLLQCIVPIQRNSLEPLHPSLPFVK